MVEMVYWSIMMTKGIGGMANDKESMINVQAEYKLLMANMIEIVRGELNLL